MAKSSKKTSKKFIQNPDIIDSQIDDEIVMMDVEKGAYFGLDPVGSFIWQALEKPHSLIELVDMVVARYDVTAKRCKPDIDPFVKRLTKANLLIVTATE